VIVGAQRAERSDAAREFTDQGTPMDDCIFCQVAAGTARSWKVHETDHAYAFLDIHPVNEYHTLVIPKRHYTDIFDVPTDELLNLISALKDVVDLYHDKLGIEDVQIVNSSGAAAQQDVFHLHFHIVPRHAGDGQDIRWSPDPGMRERFGKMLAALV
jgi:histidine triad (HIT) family protein